MALVFVALHPWLLAIPAIMLVVALVGACRGASS